MFKFFLFVSGALAHDVGQSCDESRDPNSINGGAIDQDPSYEHQHCAVAADGGHAFGHLCCSCDIHFVTGDHYCHVANKTGVNVANKTGVVDIDVSDTGNPVYMATQDDTVQRQLTHSDAHLSCNRLCRKHLGLTHAEALRRASDSSARPYSLSSSAEVRRHAESDPDSDSGETEEKESHKTGSACVDSRSPASIHGLALDKSSGDKHQHCAVEGANGTYAFGHICCECDSAPDETLDHYCFVIADDVGTQDLDVTDSGAPVFFSDTDGHVHKHRFITHADVHESCDAACSAAGF